MAKNNACIVETAEALGCTLIPFHTFEPSDPAMWADQCHLHKAAMAEKARFVGDALLSAGEIPDYVRTLPVTHTVLSATR